MAASGLRLSHRLFAPSVTVPVALKYDRKASASMVADEMMRRSSGRLRRMLMSQIVPLSREYDRTHREA